MRVIMVGIAATDETYTNHLIDQLDDYLAYGVNTIAVCYMWEFPRFVQDSGYKTKLTDVSKS